MGYKRAEKINLYGVTGSNNPNDSTTYYFDLGPRSWGTAALSRTVYIPFTGVISYIDMTINCLTINGTAEDWSIYLRHNNTTDHLINTVGVSDANRRYLNELNLNVTAGDYIEFKTTTPAWVTNPENVSAKTNIIMKI